VTRIKICGFTSIPPALTAASAGAEFIGLVFAPSRRQIGKEEALQIAEAVHGSGSNTEVVGVFVNEELEVVNQLVEYCRLDRVQLSGDESWEYCGQVARPVIKAIHIPVAEAARIALTEGILNKIDQGHKLMQTKQVLFLLDSKVRNLYGGTGETFNWQLAKEVTARFPVLIAGGLTPENAGDVIRETHPWGVDVSTGVETGNEKDEARIISFIRTVREADKGSESF